MGAKLSTSGGGAAAAFEAINPWVGAAGSLLGLGAGMMTPDNVHSGSGAYASGPFVVGPKIVGQGNEAGDTGATQATGQPPGAPIYAAPGVSASAPLSSWLPLVLLGGAAIAAVVIVTRRK